MTSHPSLAVRLLGAATLLLAVPASAATPSSVPAPVQVAQAPQPAAPLTVPVQQPAPAKPDAAKPAAAPAVPDEAQRRGDDRRAYVEAGIAALHAGLLLTPAQQGLWPPVETALRDLAATRGGMRREHGERREDGFTDPLARLKERGARLVARGQAMGRLADAAGPLLAALTPEQKERVPRLLRRITHGRMGGRFAMEGRGREGRGMERGNMERGGMERGGMERGGMERYGMEGRGRDGERFGRGGDDRP